MANDKFAAYRDTEYDCDDVVAVRTAYGAEWYAGKDMEPTIQRLAEHWAYEPDEIRYLVSIADPKIMYERRTVAVCSVYGEKWEVDTDGRVYRDGVAMLLHHRFRISGKNLSRHRLICHFHSEQPNNDFIAAHWDDDPDNNRPHNLRWATHSENSRDARRNGFGAHKITKGTITLTDEYRREHDVRPHPRIKGVECSRPGRVFLNGRELDYRAGKHHPQRGIKVAGTHFDVHVLVCETFHGLKQQPTLMACHRTDLAIGGDNSADNMYWGTYSDNAKDAHRNGLLTHVRRDCTEATLLKKSAVQQGEKGSNAKLSEAEVLAIIALWHNNSHEMTIPEIAAGHKVGQNAIRKIIDNVTWRHIPRPWLVDGESRVIKESRKRAEKDVLEIIDLLWQRRIGLNRRTIQPIADEYGRSASAIKFINHSYTWKHLPRPWLTDTQTP